MSMEQRPAIRSHLPPPPPPAPPQTHQQQHLSSVSTPPQSTPNNDAQATPQPTTPLPAQKQNAASTTETSRKRARPTVSCLECRRKKMKCDRVQPCSQCVKSRRADSCQFATGVAKVGASAGVGGVINRVVPQNGDVGSGSGSLDDGAERGWKRMRVEDLMTPNSVEEEVVGKRDVPETTRSSLGRIHVKGNRSRYLGVADTMVVLDHFEDAKNYIKNCFSDPDTAGLMYELSRYQKSFQRKSKKPDVELSRDRASLITEMLKSISAYGSLGEAYYNYETHWEGLTRVLHTQTFGKEIEEVEKSLQSQASTGNYSLPPDIRESVVPLILGFLILSARIKSVVSTAPTEEQIAVWMEMIQRWLDGLKGKERLNIQTLRVQILLLLSKMNNLAQNSDLWKESGTLVRSAMILGLHQDPEDHDVISLFEKEQRRKLWRTTVELDLQFSLAGGMPAAICASDFKSRPLVNVDDAALKDDMVSYPESYPERLWTDALPQIIMSSSIGKRLEAAKILAGSIDLPKDAETLIDLARYLEHSLQDLPTPSREEKSWGQINERSPGRLFTKVMLDVKLRRPTLCIYLYIMLSGQGERYTEGRKGALRNAVAMLGHLDALDPEVADPNTIKNRDQLNLFHVLCKKDIIQAALILCLEIRSFSLASREREGRANDVLPWTKTSLTRIVENALTSLLQRLGEFGSDLKDILPVSIVLQSARSDGSPEDKRVLMKKGAERVLKACRETLPRISATPAPSQDRTSPTSNSNVQHPPLLEHNVVERPLPGTQQFNTRPKVNDLDAVYLRTEEFNTPRFSDLNMLPGSDLDFQGMDFSFADWDMNGTWF